MEQQDKGNRRQRVIIENVTPQIDEGTFPAKRVGESVEVTADIFAYGHNIIAAYSARLKPPSIQQEEQSAFAPWADLWYLFMGGRFEIMHDSPLIPSDMEQFGNMLVPSMLEKAVYEMGCELNDLTG